MTVRMIDVGEKTPTRRRAVASGRITVGADAFERIRTGTLPKGDVLALAEVAGIMAAKKASDFIPLCHPLGLEKTAVYFELEPAQNSIRAECEAVATAKTGVEMEALAGVSAALLSIYDLTKGVNPALWISDIHLETKEGGKSGFWRHPDSKAAQTTAALAAVQGIRFGTITVSDRVSRSEAQDGSGPAIHTWIQANGGTVSISRVVPDEKEQIQTAVRACCEVPGVRVVILTGGTGIGPRDLTPEALAEMADREIPGVGELLRKSGSAKTALSWISRSSAYQFKKNLLITLPGSVKAVNEGLEALLPLIAHSLKMIDGGGHG